MAMSASISLTNWCMKLILLGIWLLMQWNGDSEFTFLRWEISCSHTHTGDSTWWALWVLYNARVSNISNRLKMTRLVQLAPWTGDMFQEKITKRLQDSWIGSISWHHIIDARVGQDCRPKIRRGNDYKLAWSTDNCHQTAKEIKWFNRGERVGLDCCEMKFSDETVKGHIHGRKTTKWRYLFTDVVK